MQKTTIAIAVSILLFFFDAIGLIKAAYAQSRNPEDISIPSAGDNALSSLNWNSIIASVIGALIFFVIQWLWKNILPNVILHFQKGEPRIDGEWKTEFKEDGKEYHEKVKLIQKGRNVKATIVLKDNDDEIEYQFTGTFQHLILSGTYVCMDEANFERGAILLRYEKKDRFVGQQSFFSKTSTKVVSSDYKWEKV
jgi:hypothetical protein